MCVKIKDVFTVGAVFSMAQITRESNTSSNKKKLWNNNEIKPRLVYDDDKVVYKPYSGTTPRRREKNTP